METETVIVGHGWRTRLLARLLGRYRWWPMVGDVIVLTVPPEHKIDELHEPVPGDVGLIEYITPRYSWDGERYDALIGVRFYRIPQRVHRLPDTYFKQHFKRSN